MTALLDDLRSVAPAARGPGLRDRRARIGHLEITIDEGVLFPLRSGRGATIGFFFSGAGRYDYRSEDPVDRVVIATNVSRETKAPIYHNFTVSDRFERLVVMFAAPVFEDLWGAPAGDAASGSGVARAGAVRPDASGAALTDALESDFARIWKRIQESYLPYDHLAARARLNGGPLQHVYVEFEGGAETAGYTYDRMDAFSERLTLFRKIQGIDYRIPRLLSDQQIEGGRSVQPPDLRLTDIWIEIATDDNRTATITSVLTLESGTDGLRVAHLDLLNNRDPDRVDWRSSKNRLVLRSVKDHEGGPLPFSHRYYEVLVELPAPLARGERRHLRFETHGEILTDGHGRHADNYFELWGDAWYPRPPMRRTSGFSSTLKIRTRAPFRPVASGRELGFRETGGFYEQETRSPATSYGPVVFAGNYRTREEIAGSVPVRSNAYADELKESQEKIPKIAGQFLRFYESLLGPYPFGKLDIIEIPTSLIESGDPFHGFGVGWGGFGVAPAGLVLLSSEAYNPYKLQARLNAYRDFMNTHNSDASARSSGADSWGISRGVNARLAHEVAHQWFPHQAMPATARDAWLSESFAEYLSGLAMSLAQTEGRDMEGYRQQFDGWRFEAKACKDVGSLETATMLGGPSGDQEYACLVYNRGPLVLHMLHTLVGNETFFGILKRFLERGKAGPVTSEDLRQAAEAVLQADMAWFFDQWVRQGGIPEIKIDYRVSAGPDDTFVLAGRAVQADGPSFKKIHIPFVLDMGDDRRDLRLLFQDQPVKEFRFDLPGKPKKVSIDPAQNNLAVYR